jgi:hypothetical protein
MIQTNKEDKKRPEMDKEDKAKLEAKMLKKKKRMVRSNSIVGELKQAAKITRKKTRGFKEMKKIKKLAKIGFKNDEKENKNKRSDDEDEEEHKNLHLSDSSLSSKDILNHDDDSVSSVLTEDIVIQDNILEHKVREMRKTIFFDELLQPIPVKETPPLFKAKLDYISEKK